MAKKRITLVKDFEEILERGNLEELKKVFEKCDINAKASAYKPNAFFYAPLSREFATWLKEQGCDINLKDIYGNTPLFSHINREDFGLMIELGADVHIINKDGWTLLHTAADRGAIKEMEILLLHGLDINIKTLNQNSYTPLEIIFITSSLTLPRLLETAEILISNGALITDVCKKGMEKRGKQFEFYKDRYTEEGLVEASAALEKLYELIGVEPPKLIEKHDGKSPIIITEQTYTKQYNKLIEYLVPGSGVASTAQGELIRIVSKVEYELSNNGGVNWDKDFKTMLDMIPQYINMGNALTKEEIEIIKKIIKYLKKGDYSDELENLIELAVKWVLNNQDVLPIITPTYNR